MTPIGHSLMGASIAVAVAPRGVSALRRAVLIASFVALANVPDFRFTGWGHDRYDISHSVFVSTLLIALLVTLVAMLPRLRRCVGGPLVIVGGAAAWLSHLLLDSFYNHGQGIAIFWPFGSGRLRLPIPWFATLDKPLPYFDAHSFRIMVIELAAYGTFFVLVCLSRRTIDRLRSRRHSICTP